MKSGSNEFQYLLKRIDFVIDLLDVHRDLLCHSEVNQFYYMEKRAELLFLSEQIEGCEKRVTDLSGYFKASVGEIEARLERDSNWLCSHTGNVPPMLAS